MGNRTSQPKCDDEETRPILSEAAPNLQSSSGRSGYGTGGGGGSGSLVRSMSSPALLNTVPHNGLRSLTTNFRLKTEQKRDPAAVRKPFVYTPLTPDSRNGEATAPSAREDQRYAEDDRRRGFARRLHYFHRLDRRPDSILAMPDHVVPADFWTEILGPAENKHNSVVTIFSLWNTMMGTSLLSMPWAVEQAGFIGGIVLLLLMALIMFYTSYLVLKSVHWVTGKTFSEFSEVCGHFLGKFASSLATFSSLVTLLGGMIVYWILLSNFLYHIVVFIYNKAHSQPFHNGTAFSSAGVYGDAFLMYSNSSGGNSDVTCRGKDNMTANGNGTGNNAFEEFWTETLSVPLILNVLLIWLVNFKSATIFTKLNSLGVVSVVYLLIFTCVKAADWGINLHLGWSSTPPAKDPYYAPDFKATFPALTGVCALAYFVQNCVIAITRNNRHPENNVRDLSIAYCLVAFCYTFVGVMIYMAFPMDKTCIEDNFLNNIAPDDVMAFVAHILLFFQMTCVFPLLTFILRSQFFLAVLGTVWPSFKHVVALSAVSFAICTVFAIFLPHIGRIIGFVGAFCGLAYAIALPCCVYIQAQRKSGTLTKLSLVVHCILIVIGAANFIAQFVIIGKTT